MFKVLAFEASEDIMTKFKSQALHVLRIKYSKAGGSGNPPSSPSCPLAFQIINRSFQNAQAMSRLYKLIQFLLHSSKVKSDNERWTQPQTMPAQMCIDLYTMTFFTLYTIKNLTSLLYHLLTYRMSHRYWAKFLTSYLWLEPIIWAHIQFL